MGNVCNAIFSHFPTHFKARNFDRHGTNNLQFRILSSMEGVKLIIPLRLEEVKVAVWDYDSYKSHEPYEIILVLLKSFGMILRMTL